MQRRQIVFYILVWDNAITLDKFFVSSDTEGSTPQMTALAKLLPSENRAPMLTGSQIRAARALLKWSGQELARRSGVSYPAIQRAETADGMPNMLVKNLAAIKASLEDAGCVFLDGPYSGDGGPGVRLKAPG